LTDCNLSPFPCICHCQIHWGRIILSFRPYVISLFVYMRQTNIQVTLIITIIKLWWVQLKWLVRWEMSPTYNKQTLFKAIYLSTWDSTHTLRPRTRHTECGWPNRCWIHSDTILEFGLSLRQNLLGRWGMSPTFKHFFRSYLI
jgi:hypothetical protein